MTTIAPKSLGRHGRRDSARGRMHDLRAPRDPEQRLDPLRGLRAVQLEAGLARLDYGPETLQARSRVDRLHRELSVQRADVVADRVGLDVDAQREALVRPCLEDLLHRVVGVDRGTQRRGPHGPVLAVEDEADRPVVPPANRVPGLLRGQAAHAHAADLDARRDDLHALSARRGGSGSDRGGDDEKHEPLHVQEFRPSPGRTVGSAP